MILCQLWVEGGLCCGGEQVWLSAVVVFLVYFCFGLQ